MNIMIVNGSPRIHGNSAAAVKLLCESIEKNLPEAKVETVRLAEKKIAPCLACDGCRRLGACVQKDDMGELMEKLYQTDALILVSPVYWWGISAQTKLFVDRMYAAGGKLNSAARKLGVIAIGADGPESPQYELIKGQFACIAHHMRWPFVFCEGFSAHQPGEIAGQKASAEKISGLWKALKE